MNFEWNPNKATSNLADHGVDFADAVTVLDDMYAITIEDRNHSEERFVTLGMDALGRTLVVVYTHRGNNIRLISARKAEKRERKEYSNPSCDL